MNQPLTIDKKVILKPYVARDSIKYELMTDQEILDNAGGILIFDTECYQNYFLIAFKHLLSKKIIMFELDSNPMKLSWIMHSYCTVGFNSNNYDIPIVWAFYHKQDFLFLRAISDSIIFNQTRPRELQNEFSFQIHKTNSLDLISVCPGHHSLKLYMGRLHSARLQDLPFPIDKPLDTDQIQIVKEYCINDLSGTEELFIFNKERIQLREELGREYGTDLRSKSDAQMAEAMVAKEIQHKTGKWPKKADLTEAYSFAYDPPPYLQFATPQLQKLLKDVCATEFCVRYGTLDRPELFAKYHFQLGETTYKFGIGGLHSCEETISYRASADHLLIDRDVSSYYPRIITSLGLYPEHLGPVFLEVYEKMMEDRLYAKKHKLFAKDKGLKIATNGISGKFNSEYSIVYSPKCYLQMTLTGQLSVLMLAEMLECNGIKIISANTDGIVSYCPQSKYQELLKWVDYWEKATGFLTEETQYSAYYGRDVNAYFALKLDGTVKVKGPYSEVGSQTGTKLDNNPICLICSDAVKALLSNGTSIEKTINECRDLTRFITVRNVASPGAHKGGYYLGKVIRWFYSTKSVGTINYIASGNKVPDTEGAWPCQDLPTEWPDHLNSDWYVKKTIEILFEIGYLKRIEQCKLF